MARYSKLIKAIAETLEKEGLTATFKQVGDALNSLGLKTTFGTEYSGTRGVAKIINDSYDELFQNNDSKAAENVANAFTDIQGKHPWQDKD